MPPSPGAGQTGAGVLHEAGAGSSAGAGQAAAGWTEHAQDTLDGQGQEPARPFTPDADQQQTESSLAYLTATPPSAPRLKRSTSSPTLSLIRPPAPRWRSSNEEVVESPMDPNFFARGGGNGQLDALASIGAAALFGSPPVQQHTPMGTSPLLMEKPLPAAPSEPSSIASLLDGSEYSAFPSSAPPLDDDRITRSEPLRSAPFFGAPARHHTPTLSSSTIVPLFTRAASSTGSPSTSTSTSTPRPGGVRRGLSPIARAAVDTPPSLGLLRRRGSESTSSSSSNSRAGSPAVGLRVGIGARRASESSGSSPRASMASQQQQPPLPAPRIPPRSPLRPSSVLSTSSSGGSILGLALGGLDGSRNGTPTALRAGGMLAEEDPEPEPEGEIGLALSPSVSSSLDGHAEEGQRRERPAHQGRQRSISSAAFLTLGGLAGSPKPYHQPLPQQQPQASPTSATADEFRRPAPPLISPPAPSLASSTQTNSSLRTPALSYSTTTTASDRSTRASSLASSATSIGSVVTPPMGSHSGCACGDVFCPAAGAREGKKCEHWPSQVEQGEKKLGGSPGTGAHHLRIDVQRSQAAAVRGLGLGIELSTSSSPSSEYGDSPDRLIGEEGEEDFSRDLEALHAFARSLPSPLPRQSLEEQGGMFEQAQDQHKKEDEDKTIVVRPAAAAVANGHHPRRPSLVDFQAATSPPRLGRRPSQSGATVARSSSIKRKKSITALTPRSRAASASNSTFPVPLGPPLSAGATTPNSPHSRASTKFHDDDGGELTSDVEDSESDGWEGMMPASVYTTPKSINGPSEFGEFGELVEVADEEKLEHLLVREEEEETNAATTDHEHETALANGGGKRRSTRRPDRVLDMSGRPLSDGNDAELDGTTHLLLRGCKPSSTPLISGDRLSWLERGFNSGLGRTLKVLDISSCGLKDLPPAFAFSTTLEELNLSHNPLTGGVLPPGLSSVTSLRMLLADSCGLYELPLSLFALEKLHTLSVRKNRLSSLPGTLSRLQKLDVLLLDDNQWVGEWADLVKPLLAEAESTSYFASPLQADSSDPTTTDSGLPSSVISRHASPFASRPASPGGHAFSTPPPSSKPDVDLQEALARLRPQSDHIPVPSPRLSESQPSSSGTAVDSKWGKMLKKVSLKKPKDTRPGGLRDNLRSVSEPIVPSDPASATLPYEAGSIRMNRSKTGVLAGLVDQERAASSRRKSYLKLEPLPPLRFSLSDTPLGTSSADGSPAPIEASAAAVEPTAASKSGLRSLVAYLKDIDDLTASEYDLVSQTPDLSRSPEVPRSLHTSPSIRSLRTGASDSERLSFRRRTSSRATSPDAAVRSRSNSIFLAEQHTPVPSLPSPAVPVSKLRSDPSKRDQVIREIVETERSYVRGLDELCGIYVKPASVLVPGAGSSKETVIPAPERRVVFSNVEAIRDFHRGVLLPDFVAALEAATSPRPLGDLPDKDPTTARAEAIALVFIRQAVFLKLYATFVNGFDTALARLATWSTSSRTAKGATSPDLAPLKGALSSSQRKRVKAFLKRCRANSRHSQISLESYLLLPVQRIPRYRLLLEQLVSCCPAAETAPESLVPNALVAEALELISSVATELNEAKRESEGREQLLLWQNRIGMIFKSPLVQPHRTLIKTGTLVSPRLVKLRDPAASHVGLPPVVNLDMETIPWTLTALLCTDLIVLLREASVTDMTTPVEFHSVLRFSRDSRKDKVAATVFQDTMLRVAIDRRQILYCDATTATAAQAWASAINLQAMLSSS